MFARRLVRVGALRCVYPAFFSTTKAGGAAATTASSSASPKKPAAATKRKPAAAAKPEAAAAPAAGSAAPVAPKPKAAAAKAVAAPPAGAPPKPSPPPAPVAPPPSPPKPSPPRVVEPPWLRHSVRYVDTDVVILSKPAGVPSQPGVGESGGSPSSPSPSLVDLLPALEQLLAKGGLRGVQGPSDSGGPPPPPSSHPGGLRLVHRLDKDVSGLMVIARTKEAAAALSDGLARGALRKRYFGVAGHPLKGAGPEPPYVTGVCRVPVTRTEWAEDGSVVGKVEWEAETAWTAATVPNRGGPAGSALTLFSLEPATGRRHQLRQHVQSILGGRGGLLGDPRYFGSAKGGAQPPSKEELAGGLLLHSASLTIPARTLGAHQGKEVSVVDELPDRIRGQLIRGGVPARVVGELVSAVGGCGSCAPVPAAATKKAEEGEEE
jgi:23S rRNA-/tRNA-specific pseudouridylate synthase